MQVDLSDVPESAVMALLKVKHLAEEGSNCEVRVRLQDGGMQSMDVVERFEESDLRKLAARENGHLVGT